MKKIVLASGSPRRKELLERFTKDFEIIPSEYEEDMTLDMPPEELAKHLSLGKAKDVADELGEGLVVGADTFVSLQGKVIGKPKDLDDAKETLRKYSGTHHSVFTGITVIDASDNKTVSGYAETKVYFRELSDEEIDIYVQNDHVLDKAGSYAYQDRAATFVEKIYGDYYTIVGLPISTLDKILKQFGVNLLTL